MAASRRAPGRPAPTALSTPPPKPILSVEEWENLAPLSDAALRNIQAIKIANEKAPLPMKFSSSEASHSRSSTPTGRLGKPPGSRPETPITRTQQTHPLHPKQPIHTPQQFYDWLSLIDRSVAHSQESHFRVHVAHVASHLEACDDLISKVDDVGTEVDSMLKAWEGVEAGGKSLKDACERLLDERDQLLATTQEIDMRLEYFQELDSAVRMLNHPGDSLVLKTDFLYMVERVDVCIEYLKTHREYKESEIYLLRFQQCLTRAMTLIKMFFVGSLRALTSDLSRRLTESGISSTAQMHLLYTRFASTSSQLAPLLRELERRAASHPEELSSLLTECHQAYFASRKGLLVGRLMEEIRGLDPSRTELVELTRSGCSFLKQLCIDEYELYRKYFNSGEEELYAYLETLCDYLYDDLRPRILHEPRLTALCEVCTVLQALMVLDVPSAEDEDDEDDEKKKKGLGKLHISHLLQMVLQDAQTRLFFKAQSLIQSEIRYFVPRPEDLAYPDKLVEKSEAIILAEKEKQSIGQIFEGKVALLDKQETWYPTMRKLVWVLSQLRDFVKPAIFNDIAQEALALCRTSLATASDLIKAHTSGAASSSSTIPIDGHLFLVRHLLTLKEIEVSLELMDAEVNDPLSNVLKDLSLRTGVPLFGTNAPSVKGTDNSLRQACEDVIVAVSQPFLSLPPTTANLPDRFTALCSADLRSSISRIRLYLEDGKTANVLVDLIRKRVSEWLSSSAGNLGAEGVKMREVLRKVCEEVHEA